MSICYVFLDRFEQREADIQAAIEERKRIILESMRASQSPQPEHVPETNSDQPAGAAPAVSATNGVESEGVATGEAVAVDSSNADVVEVVEESGQLEGNTDASLAIDVLEPAANEDDVPASPEQMNSPPRSQEQQDLLSPLAVIPSGVLDDDEISQLSLDP